MLATISIMFVDVRGFTAMAERIMPEEAVSWLKPFYRLAAREVFEMDGTLDKMVGDQVMAFFGAPFNPDDHATRAVRVALNIVFGVKKVAGEGAELPVGGGVATGEVYMGNVGEGEVRDFTVIGDAVNTAARLQAAAGPGEVLVTEDTYQAVSTEFATLGQRTLELKGKEAPLVAYALQLQRPDS